ncbi:hypothetical protein, partial [Sediminimonas sp.]|uniref:hypothetical protein n=1 Tax=Sediminimonas sp. TaxID=2823379 RepID=UPI0025F2ECFF
MVEIADIKDEDSLRAWLEDQSREVSVWIASRAAARLLPVWWDAVLDWAYEEDLTALPVLRSLLIASVAAVGPADDIRSDAAAAAADAADAAFVSAVDAAAEAAFVSA